MIYIHRLVKLAYKIYLFLWFSQSYSKRDNYAPNTVFAPGVSAKILLEMSEASDDKLKAFKLAIEQAYPENMKKLNHILSLIEIDGR